MIVRKLRCAVKLTDRAEKDAALAALEAALGRSAEPVLYLKGAGVLSLWLTEGEIDRVLALPEVRSVSPDRCSEIPPKPKHPKMTE